ncbi:glyceraldehyde 3-phosphate dehydrogenase NAD-binding domain-containing protein [Klebsiella pneumoniae]|nr:glyceraldehyde 3-phosphate dehydrogenase NAD-binding domain-containing protein [Klebsiella pneumoniae]
MVKVGINGFGRIGRNVLRAALNNPDIQIPAAQRRLWVKLFLSWMGV